MVKLGFIQHHVKNCLKCEVVWILVLGIWIIKDIKLIFQFSSVHKFEEYFLAALCVFIETNWFLFIFLSSNDPEDPPRSFCIVRISSKAPSIVVRIAFLGGTPGTERHKVILMNIINFFVQFAFIERSYIFNRVKNLINTL